MVMKSKSSRIFTELYPVRITDLPELYAWKLATSAFENKSLGWKLAYRLRKYTGGHWIWGENRLVADIQMSDDKMRDFLQSLWQDTGNDFVKIRGIQKDDDWSPQPLTQAEFVAQGLLPDLDRTVRENLKKHRRAIRNAYIERDYYVRGWEFDGKPVVSISISSSVKSQYLFSNIARQSEDKTKILGLLVQDTTSENKGEVIEIVGPLSEHRARLLQWTTRDRMRKLIEIAPNDELVLKMKSGAHDGYDYIASTLQLVVRPKDYQRLQIDGQQALRALQIPPELRSSIVQELADIIHSIGYIHKHPVSASRFPDRFVSADELKFAPQAMLGDGYVCQANASVVLNELRKHPPYRRYPDFEAAKPIRIGVLNLLGDNLEVRNYLARIRDELQKIRFTVEFTGAGRANVKSQLEIEQTISAVQANSPHVVLAFLPGSPAYEDIEDDNIYNQIKSYMLKKAIQSQFVYEHTLGNEYALANIVLGIIAKTGNVPYVLHETLPYADILAGVDVARVATNRRSGSISLPAVTRIYTPEGDFIRYVLSEGPIEGETLPKRVLRQLFPAEYFAHRRVIVHRDGPFRGNEIQDLGDWGAEIGSKFCLVEVIKSGVPRMYLDGHQKAQQPTKGDAIILNETEAFLISSLPPHKNSTPRPLLVRTDKNLSIEQALHSVLSMTVVHYGSTLQPRLPVTIHYSDKIGYLALRGVIPVHKSGDRPYWL